MSASTLIKGTFGVLVFWWVELLGVESKEEYLYKTQYLSVKFKNA